MGGLGLPPMYMTICKCEGIAAMRRWAVGGQTTWQIDGYNKCDVISIEKLANICNVRCR